MTASATRLRVNEEEVAARIIDGEAIIINLSNGLYYSLDRTGAEAWRLLAAGHTVDEAAAILARRYGVDAAPIVADLQTIVQDIATEQLMHADADLDAPRESVDLGPVDGTAYEPPKLNKYSDMEAILALDPPMPDLTEEPWSGDAPDASE